MRSSIGGLWLTCKDVLMCGQPLALLSGPLLSTFPNCGPLRATGLVS